MKSGTHSTAPALCAGILASVMLAGCGGSEIPMAEVEGEVKFDGQPIEWGTITFVPSDGKGPTTGGHITNGQFSVMVPPGAKRIEVSSPNVVGQRREFDTPDSPLIDVTKELLPADYNVNSTLLRDVELPKTRIDLDLSRVPPRP